jgi:hypothetical protein
VRIDFWQEVNGLFARTDKLTTGFCDKLALLRQSGLPRRPQELRSLAQEVQELALEVQELAKLNAKLARLASGAIPVPRQPLADAPAQQHHKVLSQVAELAGLGTAEALSFCLLVNGQIIRTRVAGLDLPVGGKPRSVRLRRYQGRDSQKRDSFLKAERAVRAAKESILSLDKRDQAKLRRALICDAPLPASLLLDNAHAQGLVKEAWNHWTDQLLMALSDWTGSNPFTAPGKKGKGGRRRGAVANWQLQTFVERLWEAANIHGGSLYADHKSVDGGTMIKALRLLAPLLPTGFIPKGLPVPAIESVIKNFKANGRRYFKAPN